MTYFETFLSKRTENSTPISITEVETSVHDLSAEEKLQFFKSLSKHLSADNEHVSVDAKDFVEYGREELMNYIGKQQLDALTDQHSVDSKEAVDERIPGLLLSRDEVTYVAHLMRKKKVTKNLSDTQLADLFSKLTGHSAQNIRVHLSSTGLESLLQKIDSNKVAEFFQLMAHMAKDREM